MGLSHDDVREILRIIDESDLDELRIDTDGFSLHVRKRGASAEAGDPAPAMAAPPAPQSAAPAPPPPAAAPPSVENKNKNKTQSHHAGEGAQGGGAGGGEPGVDAPDGLVAIPSPMLGTFYRAESPGAEPFVEVGAQVEPDTIVCIIEVMKMMNSVPAGVSGTVAEVCGANGKLVEYGEPLFRVQPQ